MKLIVGLGNPGKEYEKTRHNIGFMIVDDFLKRKNIEGRKYGKMRGDVLESSIDGQKVVFLRPMEFMNRSGGAVTMAAHFYKIEAKDILVIHDDIDFPMSKIQLKLGGSSGGHNGLKDIIAGLDTPNFRRLRIGINRPSNQDQVADYVLTPFKKEEKNTIDSKINDIEKLIEEFLSK
ncbi:MAG: aminoacyl-tRNA hydrolase [candidate division SR1 bacterium]|nr:aminoacyl-tRNA hydrolase [candidate division SR1 bacterium]